MPEDYTVTKVRYAGEKPNPHGGVLHKFYVALRDSSGVEHGTDDAVYWQRKDANLGEGAVAHGHIEQGEYGPRFKTDQRPDGAGNFQRPPYRVEKSKDDYWDAKDARIEWAWACNLAAQELAPGRAVAIPHDEVAARARDIRSQARKELGQDDADVGSSQVAHGASPNSPPVDGDAADLSAGADVGGAEHEPSRKADGAGGIPATADVSPEASPAQKGKLTQVFHAAGLSRDAMKAVVMWRCGQEKATKQGASQLITDLQEGATHDALLAEIWDAKRAGNPLGARAAALIPTEMPWEDDGSLPEAPTTDDAGVPF